MGDAFCFSCFSFLFSLSGEVEYLRDRSISNKCVQQKLLTWRKALLSIVLLVIYEEVKLGLPGKELLARYWFVGKGIQSHDIRSCSTNTVYLLFCGSDFRQLELSGITAPPSRCAWEENRPARGWLVSDYMKEEWRLSEVVSQNTSISFCYKI